MKTPSLILWAAFATAISLFPLNAQETFKPALPAEADAMSAWSVQTYSFVSSELTGGFATSARGQLQVPKFPTGQPSEQEILDYLKLSSEVIGIFMTESGIDFPKGTLFAFDAKTTTLAVRTDGATHEVLADMARELQEKVPQYINFRMQIMEADAATMRGIVAQAGKHWNHAPLLAQLEAMAKDGKAKSITALSLSSRSGQRVKTTTATQRPQITTTSLDDKGHAEFYQESTPVGTSLELDPVIGEDGETVDVTLALDHNYGQPTQRWEPLSLTAGQRVESEMTDQHLMKMNTSITMRKDSVRIIGLWSPTETPAAANLQLAFLRAVPVRLASKQNPAISELLKTHGEKVEPTPVEIKKPADANQLQMRVRRYHVPPGCSFSPGDSGSGAADPFGAALGAAPSVKDLPRNEPKITRQSSVLEILRGLGAPFPPGSSANYIPNTNIVVVRNTPENLVLLDRLFNDLDISCSPIRSIALTLHIVQGDAALLSKIEAEAMTMSDQTAAWQAVEAAVAQGQAQILRTAWLESRSGQRAKFEAGEQHMRGDGWSTLPAETTTKSPDPNTKETPPAPQAVATARVFQGTSEVISADNLVDLVGTSLEIDPVISEDGQTIDLTLALAYDPAPPTLRHDSVAEVANGVRLTAPATDFHRVNISTSVMLSPGKPRCIGLWKPEGLGKDQSNVLQIAFITADMLVIRDETDK